MVVVSGSGQVVIAVVVLVVAVVQMRVELAVDVVVEVMVVVAIVLAVIAVIVVLVAVDVAIVVVIVAIIVVVLLAGFVPMPPEEICSHDNKQITTKPPRLWLSCSGVGVLVLMCWCLRRAFVTRTTISTNPEVG